MLYFLLIILALNFVLIYVIRKTLMSPSLWMNTVYLLSTISAIIGNEMFWHIPVRFDSVLITELGIVSMFIGEVFGKYIRCNRAIKFHMNKKLGILNKKVGRIEIPTYLNVSLLVLGIAIDVVFYQFMQSLGMSSLEINESTNRHYISYPVSVLLMTRFVLAIGFIYVFIIANNSAYRIVSKRKDRETWKYIPVVITAIICNALYTSRGGILAYLLLFITVLFIMLYRFSGGVIKKKDFANILKKISLLIAVFFVFFTAMGIAMEKFGRGMVALRLVLTYMSGGVLSFSLWLDQVSNTHNTSAVKETFRGFYTLLNHLGAHINMNEFTSFNSRWNNGLFASNVLGSFKPYYYDFGLLGVVLINFILGYIYIKLMKIPLMKKNNYIHIFLSLYFLYGLLYTSIDPPTRALFSLAWISQFIIMIVVAKYIFMKSSVTDIDKKIYLMTVI